MSQTHHFCISPFSSDVKNMACHLTTADFINQQADGPFLDATWKCRVPGCGKVPGEHPAPIVQPGNYLIH